MGCVIEKDGAIISSGRTSLNGRPHAEYNALNKNKNFKNSNIYITLEPCSHYGLTPPCTNIIIKKKIKKVFFSAIDPDKRSKNKSKNIFKKKRIFTKSLLKDDGLDFYQSYYLQHSDLLPLIDAKIAFSNDYFTKNLKNRWITNIYSRKRSHFLRSIYDCIISTSKSINEDDSMLNCRLDGLENRSPDVVIIDRNLDIKLKLKIFKNNINRKIILFTSKKNNKKILSLKKSGVNVILLNSMKNIDDFKKLFLILKSKKYSRILIETGLTFLNFLIKNNFLNNIYLFKSSLNLKKNGINYSNPELLKKIKLKNRISVNLLGDKFYKEKLK